MSEFINLKHCKEENLLVQYVELRNLYCQEMLTKPVSFVETKNWLSCANIELWGLVENGILLGVVGIYLNRGNEIMVFVRNVDRGCGKKLIAFAEQLANKNNLSRLYAFVRTDNQLALALFSGCGFSRAQGFFERDFDGKRIYGAVFSKSMNSNFKNPATVVVMQPGYLPWLGFFELLWRSDVFVIYDTTQYTKNDWRNRNRIKTANGAQWLTVPVLTAGRFGQSIKDTVIDYSRPWAKEHLRALELNYCRARYFEDYFPIIKRILLKNYASLVELDYEFIANLSEIIGLKRQVVRLSDLPLKLSDDKILRLIEITSFFGGKVFYEPAGGKAYFSEDAINLFSEQGIKCEFQDYKHPIYRQLYGEFMPNLSVIDLLFNEGPRSLDILTNQTEAK